MRGVFAGFVQVRVSFRPRRQEDRAVDLPAGATVGDLLQAVGQGAASTLAVRGSTPIPEDTPLVAGETVLLLSAFSGG
jgi:sulfur carrier protein ThiS